MKNSVCIKVSLSLGLLLLSPLVQGSGAIHGGGGNICTGGVYSSNLTELADIDSHKTGFADSNGLRFGGKYLNETLSVFGYFGFDLMRGLDDYNSFFQDATVRNLLKSRIHDYISRAEKNPAATNVLKNLEVVIGAHPFLVFNDSIDAPIAPGNLTKTLCPVGARAVIRFSLGFGFLSLIDFNKMSLNQQAWLLIHESLRWVQQNFKSLKFSDTSVERLTRAIVLNDFSSPEVLDDLKLLSSHAGDFLRFNKSSPAIDKFYDDVIYEGPIAILNDVMAMAMVKFQGTVDEWANQTNSIEVLRYRERAKNLLSLTNAYITGANYHGWRKGDISYHVMRIDMYRFWAANKYSSANAFVNSTLARYAEDKIQNVFKYGELKLDPKFIRQGEGNILAQDSGMMISTNTHEIDSIGLESCACAGTQDGDLEKLFEQSMTLSFNNGQRRFFALPFYEKEQAFCIAVTKGSTPSNLDGKLLGQLVRPSTAINSLGLHRCRIRAM